MTGKVWLIMLASLVLGAFAGYRLAPRPLAPTEAATQAVERKPLYYRHPMNPVVTSQLPAKDEMGMDYAPVYAEEEAASVVPGTVSISPDKVQKLGVASIPVELRDLAQTVHAVGVLDADERRLHNVTLKFDGYIEKLFVNATGQRVAKGQPLFELYSPELLAAQREYLIAKTGQKMLAQGEAVAQAGMESLAQGGLDRLRN